MLKSLSLDHYSGDTLFMILLLACIGGTVVGYITDSVMGDRGFGPIGNGLLTVLGVVAGIYVRNTFFGRMEPGDLALTGIFAAIAATLLLLCLGVAKSLFQR